MRTNWPIWMIIFTFSLSSCLIHEMGGSFSHEPEELANKASSGAQYLIQQAFQDIEPGQLIDYHTHILGLGNSGSGAYVHPKLQSWKHPLDRLKFKIYTSAAGIENLKSADQEYIRRLAQLIRAIPNHGKYRILAFDQFYSPDGRVHPDKTEFYIPNDYIFRLAVQYPDVFLPVISVHPYRPDALEELEKWAQRGISHVKWLPNAMGIDPSDFRIDLYYQIMKKYNMVLLTHTGEEQAVEAEEYQRLGNPLLLRKPLQHGVRVIMAHCASLGQCRDLDHPEQRKIACFQLFLRMMEEKKWVGLLFGEISALFQFNRDPAVISTILQHQELHPRLVNGSDYPLPAINMVIHTRNLVSAGFISSDERKYLNEIYSYNPLLFDYVLKRTVKHPESGQRLPRTVFQTNPALEGSF
ncbi:MAG: amidohydrolase [SAR324 cluster bacterium]|nr:amidohydrolase [SAR324 cluster bacterium]